MKQPYVIAYDITDERRLNKICRYLKGKGIHLQKSVFFFFLDGDDLRRIKADLSTIIDPATDDIRIYPVLFDFDAIALGDNEILPPGVFLHIK